MIETPPGALSPLGTPFTYVALIQSMAAIDAYRIFGALRVYARMRRPIDKLAVMAGHAAAYCRILYFHSRRIYIKIPFRTFRCIAAKRASF